MSDPERDVSGSLDNAPWYEQRLALLDWLLEVEMPRVRAEVAQMRREADRLLGKGGDDGDPTPDRGD